VLVDRTPNGMGRPPFLSACALYAHVTTRRPRGHMLLCTVHLLSVRWLSLPPYFVSRVLSVHCALVECALAEPAAVLCFTCTLCAHALLMNHDIIAITHARYGVWRDDEFGLPRYVYQLDQRSDRPGKR
jgi:hypothetical protein